MRPIAAHHPLYAGLALGNVCIVGASLYVLLSGHWDPPFVLLALTLLAHVLLTLGALFGHGRGMSIVNGVLSVPLALWLVGVLSYGVEHGGFLQLFLLFALPLTVIGNVVLPFRVRPSAHRCRKCGYDLRAHSDVARCPECGTARTI